MGVPPMFVVDARVTTEWLPLPAHADTPTRRYANTASLQKRGFDAENCGLRLSGIDRGLT